MKDKQRKRMIGYFIEATKVIAENEGVEQITARKVGQEAGYSYATLYNYFDDLNHLLVHVAFDYMAECFEEMKKSKDDDLDPAAQIIEYAKAYFTFFHLNPKAFELAYLRIIGGVPKDLAEDTPEFGVAMLLRDSLVHAADEGLFDQEKIGLIGDILVQLLHGKMLFNLTGKVPYTLEGVLRNIESEVRFIIGVKL